MWVGSALITAMSLAYFDFETLPPFVIEKLPVRFEGLWLASLRIHVAAAILSFPLCLLLMTRVLQRRVPLHRWVGRATGLLVMLGLVPSGVVLAFDAKGGASVTAGFLLSGAIVALAMVGGVRAARRRDLTAHARAMRHVVAQMSVAVTSRAAILGLDALSVGPSLAYVIALWGPVLLSVVGAELIAPRPMWKLVRVHFAERIRRDFSPLTRVVRARALVRPLARPGR
jgi:hypothetical protein